MMKKRWHLKITKECVILEVCQKGKVQIKCKRLCQVSPDVGVRFSETAKRRKVETQLPFNKNPGPKAQHERFVLPCTQVKGQYLFILFCILKTIYYFIQQGCNKLIKSDSKAFNIVTYFK